MNWRAGLYLARWRTNVLQQGGPVGNGRSSSPCSHSERGRPRPRDRESGSSKMFVPGTRIPDAIAVSTAIAQTRLVRADGGAPSTSLAVMKKTCDARLGPRYRTGQGHPEIVGACNARAARLPFSRKAGILSPRTGQRWTVPRHEGMILVPTVTKARL